jgi:hypothetical protein
LSRDSIFTGGNTEGKKMIFLKLTIGVRTFSEKFLKNKENFKKAH